MDYYITRDGELRHAAPNRGWEKDDHKYVKREWKNNRWVYTYPSDTKKNTKAKTNFADTVKKVTSTARELDAKKKLENRGKLSLEARSALTRGRNAVNNKPWVSKEYLEEVAYNSQKNDGSSATSETKKQTNTNSGTKKPTASAKVSKEYQKEVAYNSQKNQYPTDDKTAKSETKKKTNWFDEAKKKLDDAGDWVSDKLSDAGDWASDKLSVIGDGIGEYVEDRKNDWKEAKERGYQKDVEAAAKRGADVRDTDRLSSSQTTITIGNVKFVTENRGKTEQYIDTAKEYIKIRLGFDEKAAYDAAKSQENLTSLKKLAAQANITTNAKLDNSLADKTIVDAAKAVAEYDAQLKRDTAKVDSTREEYSKTIAGKVELMLEWLSGRER
jgi:hypothetical protein